MKKAFETPAIQIFRMQVSEDLTVSDTNVILEVANFRLFGRASVEDWTE